VGDTTVDLLVIGSGTGMAAALAAHESGLSVLIVEKSSVVGGSTARSGGALWLPASPVLAEAGAGDTAERAETYLKSVVGVSNPPARASAFLAHQAPAVEMLRRTTPCVCSGPRTTRITIPRRRGARPRAARVNAGPWTPPSWAPTAPDYARV